jgi:outer membrane receptor for ferrienterochelin and colicins
MKKSILLIFSIFLVISLPAQNVFKALVKDKSTQADLRGVTISSTNNAKINAISDANGLAIVSNLSVGDTIFRFSYVGYKTIDIRVIDGIATHIISMERDEKALENVTVVSSTRNNDPVESATTKVEVLGLEEMNEEGAVKPGNIASLLGDMSGIQIQQSSVTSGNSNVRIQGLEGKYTQILRDGMPLYEGYSGGFGILSIPPLDLKQIELIKGAASTLYGGGAIAGLVNLVSKKPSFSPDASFLINQTTLEETNINAYYAQRWKHVGFTLFAGQNLQKQADVDKDGFSDVPDTKSTIFHPTLFIYPTNKSYISLSWSASFDQRLGGDMLAINGKTDNTHVYYEKNKFSRNTFTLITENRFNSSMTAAVKASASLFNRDETTNTYFFSGKQKNFYSEASLAAHAGQNNLVGGVNITGDEFKPSSTTPAPVGKFSNTTFGAFMQDTWKLLEKTKIETGLRVDHHVDYGNFVLPRIALFHHFNQVWGSRLGLGMGYKTPNPLTQQIKDYDIYSLQPISSSVKAEKSIGANFEVNYKKQFGDDKTFFINHAFFITNITDPIGATEDVSGKVRFTNFFKPIVTKGFDTYVRLKIEDWELYAGYTYTYATRKYLQQNNFMLLTPRHRAACVIAYEIEHNWRFGLDGSFTGQQYREDYSKTRGYAFFAALVEKKLGPKWSLVLNCENLLDERQSKYEKLYTGSVSAPSFKSLWAPIEGRVANFSIRFKPFDQW